jgi:hypothetical protein
MNGLPKLSNKKRKKEGYEVKDVGHFIKTLGTVQTPDLQPIGSCISLLVGQTLEQEARVSDTESIYSRKNTDF